jgi:hypothetical protein
LLILRRWSVRNARILEAAYRTVLRILPALRPLVCKLGQSRLERPVAAIEHLAKGLFFDCRMCGQCMLSSSGMSCPMNCPKQLRNGPCGGVHPDGTCEIKADMSCVWVQAWAGARVMREGSAILAPQPPVNFALQGRSTWLAGLKPEGDAGKP